MSVVSNMHATKFRPPRKRGLLVRASSLKMRSSPRSRMNPPSPFGSSPFVNSPNGSPPDKETLGRSSFPQRIGLCWPVPKVSPFQVNLQTFLTVSRARSRSRPQPFHPCWYSAKEQGLNNAPSSGRVKAFSKEWSRNSAAPFLGESVCEGGFLSCCPPCQGVPPPPSFGCL